MPKEIGFIKNYDKWDEMIKMTLEKAVADNPEDEIRIRKHLKMAK